MMEWTKKDYAPLPPEFTATAHNGTVWVIWYGINNSWALGVRGEPEESISDEEEASVVVVFGDGPESLMKVCERLQAVLDAPQEPSPTNSADKFQHADQVMTPTGRIGAVIGTWCGRVFIAHSEESHTVWGEESLTLISRAASLGDANG